MRLAAIGVLNHWPGHHIQHRQPAVTHDVLINLEARLGQFGDSILQTQSVNTQDFYQRLLG